MRALSPIFRKKRYLSLLTAVCFCLGMIWVVRSGILSKRPPKPLRPLVLQYSYTLKNTTSRPVCGVQFQAAAPVKQTATQRCQRIQSNRDLRISSDRFGNQTLHFDNLDFAPRAVKVITVKAHLLIASEPQPGNRQIEAAYLAPEKFIECDHPDIRRLAARLENHRPLDTAKAFFRWVRGGIRYTGYTKTRRGAFFTLRRQRGDCTGQADLFTALCRACEIPARSLAGYICPRSMVLDPRQYHNWSEFYVNGTWHLADPQAGIFLERQSDYIAMRIMGPSVGYGKREESGFDKFALRAGSIEVRMNIRPSAASGRSV